MVFCVALLSGSQPADAWWDQGHEHITAGAIQHLPQPLREFFEENSTFLIERSGMEPSGSHWIHMDDYPSYSEGTFPREYDEVVAMYGSSFVNQRGLAPWTVVNVVDLLSSQMASAKGKSDWYTLATRAGDLAHYIEDLHNPFHLTRNYDGQYTGNGGIHARYEGGLVGRNIDELTFTPATAEYLPSVLDFVFDGIDEHFPYVEDILAADDLYSELSSEEYWAGMWVDTGAFTKVLFQQASEAVANAWYTAWVNAGSPTDFLPVTTDFNGDGLVNIADYTVWRNNLGQMGEGLAADADSNGIVDQIDFAMWKDQFGRSAVSRSVAESAAVPEPAGQLLIGIWTLGYVLQKRLFRNQ